MDILVIGESCLDIFVYCEAIRLAPDLPVPVLQELYKKKNPGMAMNVFRNIKSFGAEVSIVTNQDWESITKTRYVHDKTNHTFIRVDTPHIVAPMNISDMKYNYELIIISDYNKGFLTEQTIEHICNNHHNVFLDTKKCLGKWASNAKYIKINNYEYERSKDYIDESLEQKIITTKGSEGAIHNGKTYSAAKVEVRDTSGAGDTFMAALAVNYFKTQNIEVAIDFANHMASEVVRKKGVELP